jgi:UDP-glucose 4-epimerase
MQVLVTGASGFIGEYVVRALFEAGHDVIGLDTGKPTLEEWIDADITQPIAPIPGLDAVIHLAAISHPRDCDNQPAAAFNVNVNGTHQVLKMAMESGAKKVVFASTAHVYGISPRYLPTDETHPLWLQNNYTLTKILGEQLCQLYYENHGLSYTVLRLFNAYGPGQGLGYFIPDMMAKTEDIDLGAGGHTTKDWVYIEDVARAFVLAIETDFVGPVNIGTGIETPLHSIAGRIVSENGFACQVEAAEIWTRMCADISRAERVLGWSPSKSIWEGLDAVLGKVRSVS